MVRPALPVVAFALSVAFSQVMAAEPVYTVQLDGQLAAEGEVRVPIIHEVMTAAYVRASDGSHVVEASVHPETDHWLFRWPATEGLQDGKSYFGQIAFSGVQGDSLSFKARTVTQEADGDIKLRACDALIEGSLLRYEPQPHKNTIGYWADPSDRVSWTFQIEQSGKFNVSVLQGCGGGNGGSTLHLKAMGPTSDTIDFKVVETGHFQNFRWRTIGQLDLSKPGKYTLSLQVENLVNKAVGDFREVQLILAR